MTPCRSPRRCWPPRGGRWRVAAPARAAPVARTPAGPSPTAPAGAGARRAIAALAPAPGRCGAASGPAACCSVRSSGWPRRPGRCGWVGRRTRRAARRRRRRGGGRPADLPHLVAPAGRRAAPGRGARRGDRPGLRGLPGSGGRPAGRGVRPAAARASTAAAGRPRRRPGARRRSGAAWPGRSATGASGGRCRRAAGRRAAPAPAAREVEERARAVGVKAAVPLGLCLLPAFVLIGVVPLVVAPAPVARPVTPAGRAAAPSTVRDGSDARPQLPAASGPRPPRRRAGSATGRKPRHRHDQGVSMRDHSGPARHHHRGVRRGHRRRRRLRRTALQAAHRRLRRPAAQDAVRPRPRRCSASVTDGPQARARGGDRRAGDGARCWSR